MSDDTSSTIPILIADDHEVVRAGVRTFVESKGRWRIVAEAADGFDAVEKARETSPALVLMDVFMPRLNGIEATRQIVAALPEARVIIFTMHNAEQTVRRAFEAGAAGYLLKSCGLQALGQAMEAVLGSRYFLCNATTKLVLDGFLGGTANGQERLQALSTREGQVVQLISEGKTSKEIAARLRVSLKTAETHRYHVMRKIGAHSVADVVRFAIRNGIIKP